MSETAVRACNGMHETSVTLTSEHREWLKRQSRALGVTRSAIVRWALERMQRSAPGELKDLVLEG